jgi:hypothetical protein
VTEVTRGEFDLLKEIVTGSQTRMESIDVHGTRGVAVIQEQVTELIKDLVELKTSSEVWQKAHDAEHKTAQRDRIVGRRWLIGIGFAGVSAMAGMIAVLTEVLGKIH